MAEGHGCARNGVRLMTTEGIDTELALSVNDVPLVYTRVAEEDVVLGFPATGTRALPSYGALSVGIWEMTEGGMRDIELDELFVVTAGQAAMIVHRETGTDETFKLSPGSLVRLTKGMVTT